MSDQSNFLLVHEWRRDSRPQARPYMTATPSVRTTSAANEKGRTSCHLDAFVGLDPDDEATYGSVSVHRLGLCQVGRGPTAWCQPEHTRSAILTSWMKNRSRVNTSTSLPTRRRPQDINDCGAEVDRLRSMDWSQSSTRKVRQFKDDPAQRCSDAVWTVSSNSGSSVLQSGFRPTCSNTCRMTQSRLRSRHARRSKACGSARAASLSANQAD